MAVDSQHRFSEFQRIPKNFVSRAYSAPAGMSLLSVYKGPRRKRLNDDQSIQIAP